jgi:beta-glucanase (GH16 family)
MLSSSLAFGVGSALLSFSTLSSVSAQVWYNNVDLYDSSNFFSRFQFATADDPTHGYVDYQSSAATDLYGITPAGTIKFGADSVNTPTASARGRRSIRLEGKTSYTHGLIVADIAHMPGSSCGAWPAYWMLGPNWPTSGEIGMLKPSTAPSNQL